jgi:hypothetical protein
VSKIVAGYGGAIAWLLNRRHLGGLPADAGSEVTLESLRIAVSLQPCPLAPILRALASTKSSGLEIGTPVLKLVAPNGGNSARR